VPRGQLTCPLKTWSMHLPPELTITKIGHYGDTGITVTRPSLPNIAAMPIVPDDRIARAVVPGLPHHVTQRGNRRERVFFEEGDYALYRDWLAESCRRFSVEVLSLLPDAEPRSSHPDVAGRRRLGAGAVAGRTGCMPASSTPARGKPAICFKAGSDYGDTPVFTNCRISAMLRP
jgi:hypothetical protein